MKRAVVVALLLLLGWLVLYPLVLLLAESFRDGSRWTWAHYAAVFASAADRSALVHTLVVAAGSVVGAFALVAMFAPGGIAESEIGRAHV